MSYTAAERVPVRVAELERERILRGWSKKQLAIEAGLDPNTISQVYRDANASAKVFGRITAALARTEAPAVASRLLAETA